MQQQQQQQSNPLTVSTPTAGVRTADKLLPGVTLELYSRAISTHRLWSYTVQVV